MKYSSGNLRSFKENKNIIVLKHISSLTCNNNISSQIPHQKNVFFKQGCCNGHFELVKIGTDSFLTEAVVADRESFIFLTNPGSSYYQSGNFLIANWGNSNHKSEQDHFKLGSYYISGQLLKFGEIITNRCTTLSTFLFQQKCKL